MNTNRTSRLSGFLFLIGFSACSYPKVQPDAPALRSGSTEDQVFDLTRQSPAKFLRQAYEDHQVLVLSFADHHNERHLQALKILLEQVGQDRRLKYIVLERLTENAPVLEAASTTNLDEAQLLSRLREQFADPRVKDYFGGEDMGKASLCGVDEWVYTWSELMPRIRELNATRSADHRVLVTTVDGISSALQTGHGMESYERDSTTAAQFHSKIWQGLQRDTAARAIVVYNIAHTLRGFMALRQARTVPVNFLGTFLQDHPEARPRTALLMIDGSGNGYQFKFTERQVKRTAAGAFGVGTAPFRDVTPERGDSVFAAAKMHPCSAGGCKGGGQSTATLAEMVDGIVWLPKSEQMNFKKETEYWPRACASGTPSKGD